MDTFANGFLFTAGVTAFALFVLALVKAVTFVIEKVYWRYIRYLYRKRSK